MVVKKFGHLYIPATDITVARSKIPTGDFADKQFDNPDRARREVEKLTLILSTPRSGSTLLSSLYVEANISHPHEYFQPYEYLPFLCDRWNCLFRGFIRKRKYVGKLISNRTGAEGELGINLHGHHIKFFECFERFFPRKPAEIILLKRNDIVEQAVSYYIASNSGKWSSEFKGEVSTSYSRDAISNYIRRIENQNKLITSYLRKSRCPVFEIYYEDLINREKKIFGGLSNATLLLNSFSKVKLRKQASELNNIWVTKFKNGE